MILYLSVKEKSHTKYINFMIDTHCHIFLKHFDDDRDEVLRRAADAGLTDICMPAINLDSLSQMRQISHPKIKLHKMAGIHPCDIKQDLKTDFENTLYDLCRQKQIIAVGETGLDYYWSRDFVDHQKKSLRIHCRVAKATQKPVVLHNRESTADILDIIEDEKDDNLKGVWHCFTGTAEEGKRAIDLGLKLGIGGVTTFKNAGVDKSVAQLPLGEMIVETDAPYLAPDPKRGKRNEPAFVIYTAQKVAELFEMPLSKVDEITSANARQLFGI